MQTTKFFTTVFSTTVLLATLASASQAQLGCPFSKKSAGTTIFQQSLNNNSTSITNPSLLQNKGFWLGAGAIGILAGANVALFLKKRASANINLNTNLSEENLSDSHSELNYDVNTEALSGNLHLTENNLDNNLVVSHPEAPGGDLDVATTDLTWQEKAEEKIIALTK
jgi:hypothetical protein